MYQCINDAVGPADPASMPGLTSSSRWLSPAEGCEEQPYAYAGLTVASDCWEMKAFLVDWLSVSGYQPDGKGSHRDSVGCTKEL